MAILNGLNLEKSLFLSLLEIFLGIGIQDWKLEDCFYK